ncbi:MAG: hypothetical protein ACLSUG_04530 [Alistipes shahii]|uniref:hypothetical protein n=1 Tax=Alistipes shahii TaxID=328814 RepID=UPI0021087A04|nr:hypothetical protein [Alistipes shahii]MCQ5075141.1 hypothetical protein [Alistipes shahii]
MIKYNNTELLKSIAGSYKPSFMQIELTHSFKDGFKDFSTQQLGVFLHEYIHYLQNISTPFGLFMSMVQYNTIAKTYEQIQLSKKVIELPFKASIPELDRQWNIINIGCGTYPFNNEYSLQCQIIDRSKSIIIHRRQEVIGDKQFPKISLDISFRDGTTRSIDLGAIIINESMAAMYQMIIDPTATHPNNDFPYNLIKIICEQHFPAIADDDRKLISICYISLFSMSPAEELFNQLHKASHNQELSGIELFNDFIQNSRISDNLGRVMNIPDFMDFIIEKFKSILSKLLLCDLDYITYVLDKVKISKGIVPILTVIYNEDLTSKILENMVNFLGLPFTYNECGECFLPHSISAHEKISNDMLSLIANWALYNYLTNPNPYRCCPLKLFCLSTIPPREKEECFDFPWEGEICPITRICDIVNLKDKKFKWRYCKLP